jgi:hypothetical protein
LLFSRTGCAALLIYVCLFASPQWAATLEGPLLGYGFDPGAQRIERIRGIPGAAIVDQLLEFDVKLAQAVVSSERNFALIVDAKGAVQSLRLRSAAVTAHILPLPASPNRIVLSPSGTAAALLYAREARIITGLPDQIQFRKAIPLPDGLAIQGAAIDDAGSVILAAVAGEPHARAVRITEEGAADLPLADPISAIAFRPESQDVALAGGGRLILIQNVRQEPTFEVLAHGREDLEGALVMSFSLDGRVLPVAHIDSSSIQVFSMSDNSPVRVECRCSVSTVERLGHNAVFRLNSTSDGTPMLLDLGSQTPRITFAVPAVSASDQNIELQAEGR